LAACSRNIAWPAAPQQNKRNSGAVGAGESGDGTAAASIRCSCAQRVA